MLQASVTSSQGRVQSAKSSTGAEHMAVLTPLNALCIHIPYAAGLSTMVNGVTSAQTPRNLTWHMLAANLIYIVERLSSL